MLSLSRLPPVLLIHLKRFSVKGHFTEKIETFVDFPLRGLDLTNYMPPPLPPGVGGGQTLSPDDPRAQIPPYRYDLYGVTNHYGTLSSGHCECRSFISQGHYLIGIIDTACISSRGGWLYCDDSRITSMEAQKVVVSSYWLSVSQLGKLTKRHRTNVRIYCFTRERSHSRPSHSAYLLLSCRLFISFVCSQVYFFPFVCTVITPYTIVHVIMTSVASN